MNDGFNEYDRLMRSVLVDFQYIEEGLRSYLAACYETVQERVKAVFPFKYAYEDTEKDSLGTLVGKFEHLTDDLDLVRELRDLVRFRNGVAHRGYLLTVDEQNDVAYLRRQIAGLTALKDRTAPCAMRVLGAWESLNKKKGGEV